MIKGLKSMLAQVLRPLAHRESAASTQADHCSNCRCTVHGDLDCTIFVIALPQMAQRFGADLIDPNIGAAVANVCTSGIVTLDLGGKATTQEVTRAVCAAVRDGNLPEGARA